MDGRTGDVMKAYTMVWKRGGYGTAGEDMAYRSGGNTLGDNEAYGGTLRDNMMCGTAEDSVTWVCI